MGKYIIVILHYAGFPLKRQNKNSELCQDSSGLVLPNIRTISIPFFFSVNCADGKTRHCNAQKYKKYKLQH